MQALFYCLNIKLYIPKVLLLNADWLSIDSAQMYYLAAVTLEDLSLLITLYLVQSKRTLSCYIASREVASDNYADNVYAHIHLRVSVCTCDSAYMCSAVQGVWPNTPGCPSAYLSTYSLESPMCRHIRNRRL